MGRGREKQALHPVESHRRSMKRKAVEKKKAARKEILAKIPLAKRDPSKLLLEVERLRGIEAKGKLDGPGKLKRKHLEDQFISLNRAREKAGLFSMALPEFDPEKYLFKRDENVEKEMQHSTAKEEELIPIDIPMPDDEPYETGVPGLFPYQNLMIVSTEDLTTTAPPIIAVESNVSKDAHLDAQVDQFLNEIY